MEISKKIIFTYIFVFILVGLSVFFNMSKIINQKIEEGTIENKYLIVNLISNYEHYTLPFRSNNFLNIINRNLENTKVKHLTGGGKHSVSITLLNFKDEELKDLKEKVKEIIYQENKLLKQCLLNFYECNSIRLKVEILKIIEKNYPDNHRRMKILDCLYLKSNNKCNDLEIRTLIIDRIIPISDSYLIVEPEIELEKDKEPVFLISLIIMFIFISILFVITFPILVFLTKYRFH